LLDFFRHIMRERRQRRRYRNPFGGWSIQEIFKGCPGAKAALSPSMLAGCGVVGKAPPERTQALELAAGMVAVPVQGRSDCHGAIEQALGSEQASEPVSESVRASEQVSERERARQENEGFIFKVRARADAGG
jgi:hypothetical protein